MLASQTISSMDDGTLLKVTHLLAKTERHSQVRMLELLAEIDARRLYESEGYCSLWDYCRRSLLFSEGTTQRRLIVARVCKKFPEILEAIQQGRLTLCTAADLAPSLTTERIAELNAQASGKSRAEIQALTESKSIRPTERDVVRRVLPGPNLETNLTNEEELESSDKGQVSDSVRHRISFTANETLIRKLDRLKVIWNSSRLEEVIEKALDATLAAVDPELRHQRRNGKEAPTKKGKNPRAPPAAVCDSVKVRDGHQCTFVSRSGVRCTSERFLEIDHVQPFSMGGSSTDPANLRLLCSAHHALVTRRTFSFTSRETGKSSH